MKLSFTTLGCPAWSLDEIASRAKEYGYDGVELRTQTDNNHFSPNATLDEARKVGQLFRGKGTRISSVMGYCRFAFTDAAEVVKNQELMRKLIAIADAMGAPFIRTFAGEIPKGADPEAMTRTVGEALKPLAAEAAAKNVRIGLETHDDWCSGARVMKVVNIVDNARGFGIVYDIFNSFHSGIEPWETTYNTVKKHICYCHLKDGYKGIDNKNHYVMLGAGDLPLRDVVQRFKKDGFDGYFSFEWEKKWHPDIEGPERAFPHFPHKVRQLWGE